MKFSFYAIFEFDDDGIDIWFPDLPQCLSCAFDEEQAIMMATEVLELGLHGTKLEDVPSPTNDNDIRLESNQKKVRIDVELEIKSGKLFSPDVISFV